MLSPLLLPDILDSRNSYNKPRKGPSSRCLPAMPPSAYPLVNGSSFDDVIHRLQKLSIPSRPQSPSRSSPSIAFHPSSFNPNSLESPFAYSWPEYRKEPHDELP